MRLIDNILYIEWSELLNVGIPEGTLKSATARKSNNWNFINDPEDARKSLAEYEKLNDATKEKVKTKYGNPYNHVARQPIKNLVKKDINAERFFLDYRYDEIKTLSQEHVNKYTFAASWLNMLVEMNEDKPALKKLLNLSIDQFYIHVLELIKTENIDLPTSYRRLLAKQKEYKESSYASLIDWRFGNKIAAKVKDDAEAVLHTMIAHHNQYDDVFIAQQYNAWAITQGFKRIDSSTVGVHRRKNYHLLVSEREGNEALKEKYLKQAKGMRPSFPLAMVESDDNHIDLQFIDVETDDKFTRYKAIVVIDSFNDYVLGYAYTTDAVTIDLIKAAYINAMYYIRSITGAWHLPHEVKTDNFGIATLQPYYEKIGNYVKTPVGSKHRGYIEPFFSSKVWKTSMKLGANNYTGNNMTALTRGVNTEVVQANINNRPVIGKESETQIEKFFHRLRFLPNDKEVTKHAQWMEAWTNTPEEKKRLITDEQFLLTFGIEHNHHGNQIRITNRGVEPQINGQKYSYDLSEYNLEHIGKSVSIMYDPYDMSRVLCTDFKNVRVLATTARLNSRALADAHLDSRTFLNSILQEKKEAVTKIGNKSDRRKEVLQAHTLDAEAILQSGVLVKEIRHTAEQKYLEGPNENTTTESDNKNSLYDKY